MQTQFKHFERGISFAVAGAVWHWLARLAHSGCPSRLGFTCKVSHTCFFALGLLGVAHETKWIKRINTSQTERLDRILPRHCFSHIGPGTEPLATDFTETFNIQKLFQTDALSHGSFDTNTLLDCFVFAQTLSSTKALSQGPLIKHFSHRLFFAQTLLPAEASTQRSFYTRTLLVY